MYSEDDITKPLLTIIIPTYNRAQFVERLLCALEKDLEDLPQVRLIVGDNASTDNTPQVVEIFKSRHSNWLFIRHPENLGPDENFCLCLERVESAYFWIIGDDDLPEAGVLKEVVHFLGAHCPDLLYLRSSWLPDVDVCRSRTGSTSWPFRARNRLSFASAVNVWLTFISGMIVNMNTLQSSSPEINLRRFANTNLVQLGWVLPVLMMGHRFFTVREPWVLATSGNTGGYKLLTVFGRNLVEVVESVCGDGSDISRSILRSQLWNYLPGLIWLLRKNGSQGFKRESMLESLIPLRRFAAYRLLLFPLYRLPIPLAKILMFIPRVYGKLIWVRYW